MKNSWFILVVCLTIIYLQNCAVVSTGNLQKAETLSQGKWEFSYNVDFVPQYYNQLNPTSFTIDSSDNLGYTAIFYFSDTLMLDPLNFKYSLNPYFSAKYGLLDNLEMQIATGFAFDPIYEIGIKSKLWSSDFTKGSMLFKYSSSHKLNSFTYGRRTTDTLRINNFTAKNFSISLVTDINIGNDILFLLHGSYSHIFWKSTAEYRKWPHTYEYIIDESGNLFSTSLGIRLDKRFFTHLEIGLENFSIHNKNLIKPKLGIAVGYDLSKPQKKLN